MEVHGYTMFGSINATIDGEFWNVPDDIGNIQRQLIAEWEKEGGVIPPYVAPPEQPPQTISDRQFFQELAVREIITEEEALAAVMNGALPAAMEAIIATLPTPQRFSARMLLSGATTFERSHALAQVFGAAFGMDNAAIDQFWRDASLL